MNDSTLLDGWRASVMSEVLTARSANGAGALNNFVEKVNAHRDRYVAKPIAADVEDLIETEAAEVIAWARNSGIHAYLPGAS